MDGGVHILTNQFFVNENSILVVITFPGHKADKCVLTKGNFAVLCSRTVSKDIALLNALTSVYNGNLIDTSTLVTSEELNNLIIFNLAVVVVNTDVVSIRARFASSFSRKGIIDVATETTIRGDTSM